MCTFCNCNWLSLGEYLTRGSLRCIWKLYQWTIKAISLPQQAWIMPLLPSDQQLRRDTVRAVWGLGQGARGRPFHLTQLPRKIPTREGMHLHYRRWAFGHQVSRHSWVNDAFSSSFSPPVHRLVFWWKVFYRAIVGLQVWSHRGPRRALWLLAHHRTLLRPGEPHVRSLQREVPVHQVCGRWRVGGYRLLSPVQFHVRWVSSEPALETNSPDSCWKRIDGKGVDKRYCELASVESLGRVWIPEWGYIWTPLGHRIELIIQLYC